MKIFVLIYGAFILFFIICAVLWISRICLIKQNDIIKSCEEDLENQNLSDAIVKLIFTRNSFPLIGEQFEHLAKFEEKNQLKINSNLERYMK